MSSNGAIQFVVYGEPKTAGSKRAFYKAGMKRAVVVDDNAKSRDWKEQIASAARQHYAGPLLDCALRATFKFVRPRPKGHYTGKGELTKAAKVSAGPATKPDVLKLARCAEDALKGVLYRDDSQIIHETLSKEWGEPARCEIVIEPLA